MPELLKFLSFHKAEKFSSFSEGQWIAGSGPRDYLSRHREQVVINVDALEQKGIAALVHVAPADYPPLTKAWRSIRHLYGFSDDFEPIMLLDRDMIVPYYFRSKNKILTLKSSPQLLNHLQLFSGLNEKWADMLKEFPFIQETCWAAPHHEKTETRFWGLVAAKSLGLEVPRAVRTKRLLAYTLAQSVNWSIMEQSLRAKPIGSVLAKMDLNPAKLTPNTQPYYEEAANQFGRPNGSW